MLQLFCPRQFKTVKQREILFSLFSPFWVKAGAQKRGVNDRQLAPNYGQTLGNLYQTSSTLNPLNAYNVIWFLRLKGKGGLNMHQRLHDGWELTTLELHKTTFVEHGHVQLRQM